MTRAARPTHHARALAAALAVASASLTHADLSRADEPAVARRHAHASPARRDSDRMRRRRRYERTLDPTMRGGRAVRLPSVSRAVAFGPPPPAPTLPAGARPYDHVVVVSIDGLRPDAIDLTDAPNLRLLRAQGAWSAEARTITHSYTLPSHAAMVTGVDTDRHGLVHNNFTPSAGFVRAPTAFYYAHDAGLATAMFVSKPKLRHLALPGSVDVFTRPDYLCGPVVRAAASYLPHASPGLTFIHLSEPDEFGHSRGWMTAAYLRGVASADQCVGTLMTAIASRPDLDRVLLIISADHGGHGRTHGSERDEDMRIPWIAWGSRVARGAFSNPLSTVDTAATALAALGVAVPADMVGRPVTVAYAAAMAAPDAPVATHPVQATGARP